MEKLLAAHYKKSALLIKQRLQAAPYGTEEFAASYFPKACKKHDLSSSQIKKQWRHIRSIAKLGLSKALSNSENKLAYARLNSLEQDILYVLFVEQHYLCPLIRKKGE